MGYVWQVLGRGGIPSPVGVYRPWPVTKRAILNRVNASLRKTVMMGNKIQINKYFKKPEHLWWTILKSVVGIKFVKFAKFGTCEN